MAFDGITIAAIRKELADTLKDGRISKIAQPEPDELLLTVKTPGGQYKLVLGQESTLKHLMQRRAFCETECTTQQGNIFIDKCQRF